MVLVVLVVVEVELPGGGWKFDLEVGQCGRRLCHPQPDHVAQASPKGEPPRGSLLRSLLREMANRGPTGTFRGRPQGSEPSSPKTLKVVMRLLNKGNGMGPCPAATEAEARRADVDEMLRRSGVISDGSTTMEINF